MNGAIKANLPYPALVVALTMPDICAALNLGDYDFVKKSNYVEFVDRYTEPLKLGVNGEVCYALRGGVIHRGNASIHPRFPYKNVAISMEDMASGVHGIIMFQKMPKPPGQMWGVIGGTSVSLHLPSFCNAMEEAAGRWFADHGSDVEILERMSRMLRYLPSGFSLWPGAPAIVSGEA